MYFLFTDNSMYMYLPEQVVSSLFNLNPVLHAHMKLP